MTEIKCDDLKARLEAASGFQVHEAGYGPKWVFAELRGDGEHEWVRSALKPNGLDPFCVMLESVKDMAKRSKWVKQL